MLSVHLSLLHRQFQRDKSPPLNVRSFLDQPTLSPPCYNKKVTSTPISKYSNKAYEECGILGRLL